MGKVVMYSSVSVDGFVADDDDQPGPLFDWLSSGDVALDDSGVLKVSQASYDYTRAYWDQIGATICGRHVFDMTDGWEPFAGPDSADLDEAARERFAAAAIPVPAGVTQAVVRLRDERRYDVPVTVVCPEFSPAEVQEWIAAGDVPELAKATSVTFADLDPGHWPMFTKPAALAALLAEAARERT